MFTHKSVLSMKSTILHAPYIAPGLKLRVRNRKLVFLFLNQSKNDGKDQESIQSSTTPDPGYHMRK